MTKQDVYTTLVARLLDMMREGDVPWRRTWLGGRPHNLVSGHKYTGINRFLLSCVEKGPGWATWNQIQAKGLRVQKGAKSEQVLFFRQVEVERRNRQTGEREVVFVPMAKPYRVFAQQDIIGYEPPTPSPSPSAPLERAEAMVRAMVNPPTVMHYGGEAFYSATGDLVVLPIPERFESMEAYYATKFHELSHSTGHPSRLNRATVTEAAVFGSPVYSEEELVAEFSAAYLCSEAGITNLLPNSASYLKGWMRTFEKQPEVVVRAARLGEEASRYILEGPPAVAQTAMEEVAVEA